MSSEPAEKKAKKEVLLGYWGIRGLAQPIRLLLKYTGTDFEDIRYTEYSEWALVKETLGLDFPNLPYLFDGDIKLTQSNAILSYIGRKTNLAGTTEAEIALVDMLSDVAMDFRNGFVGLCYDSNYSESTRDTYLKNVVPILKRFSDYLGEKTWFAGENVTYVDFPFYELLDQHKLFNPELLNDFQNLKDFLDRFEALPAIKNYMESPEFSAWPVNGGPSVGWGCGDSPGSA